MEPLLLRTAFFIIRIYFSRAHAFDILSLNMIYFNDWHQSLNDVIMKVNTYDTDHNNCNDTCTASVIRELCHDRDTYHYPVNIHFCSF